MKKIVVYSSIIMGAVFFNTTAPYAAGNITIKPFSPSVNQMLETSCLDCHSDLTTPRQEKITSKALKKGRKELNFSDWESMSDRKQKRAIRKSIEQIEDGEMPTEDYLDDFPDRAVSPEQLSALIKEYEGWQ